MKNMTDDCLRFTRNLSPAIDQVFILFVINSIMYKIMFWS